jgi:hypothetical protein
MAFGPGNFEAVLYYGGFVANTIGSFSFYLKAGTAPWIRAIFDDGGADGIRAWFNPNTGQVGGISSSGTGLAISATMVPAGNGWYRCTLTGRVDADTASIRVGLITAPSDGSGDRAPNTTFGLDALQLEAGEYASSVIFTAGSQGVRNSDSAVIVGTNFSSWYNPTEGTAIVNFSRFGFDSVAGSVGVFQFDNATANERVALRITPRAKNASPQATVTVGGVVLLNEGSMPQQDISTGPQTYSLAYKVGDSALGRVGTVSNTSTFASLPTVTQATLGGGAAASGLNGHIRSIRYYASRLPNATLLNLTV